MKKLLYMAVAAIAALSSCQGDDVNDNLNVNPNLNPNVNAPVFTATIEGVGGTRTQLADGSATGRKKVEWEVGDEVKMVFAYQENEESDPGVCSFPVYQATPSTEDASTATLTIKEGETYNSAANIFLAAVYPASIVTDDMKIVFPATQQYQGDRKIGFAPMYTMSLDLSADPPQTLTFWNSCALLEITIPHTQMTSVRSITVSSDLQMNGVVSPKTDGCFCFDSPSNPGSGENQVTLDCYSHNNANVAIPESGSKTFYVSIVPRESTNNAP